MEDNIKRREYLTTHFGITANDFNQIEELGISIDQIEGELLLLKSGIPKIFLDRPATVHDGIIKLTKQEFEDFAFLFDENKSNFKLKKFVPASGAASRMFKFLNEFINDFNPEEETINGYINRKKDKNLFVFLAGIEKFPFYEEVKQMLKAKVPNYYSLETPEKSYHFIKMMLSSDGFDFANKPKGILEFHRYPTHIATPLEEHLNECAYYASSNGISNLHLTVTEQHQELFQTIVDEVKKKIENKTKTIINVSFSYQDKSTDTIAVDMNNKPFRNENGKLVFRPGGHGALINNLNRLDADIIFIKNIDNVIQNHIEETTLYKKGLAGVLIQLKEKINKILAAIEDEIFTEEDLDHAVTFMKKELNIDFSDSFNQYDFVEKIATIFLKLNRPIRVCGMVKNEGEPGGGPFWVRGSKGNVSLQIVESAQVDHEVKDQLEILSKATHFNPVDLVCNFKNFKGEKFDLIDFVDHSTGFIVHKNNKGRELKGYELPGLWNGAMAKWITIFVEVPLVTFNPVKTVNDLLKPSHQPMYE